MEFRVLQYFLAVAGEQSISAAAKYLHLSQSTLSRQLKELEDELGKTLFLRGNRKITLTEEGKLLRTRAEEIVRLVQKTENEITLSEAISGDVYIGAGETEAVRFIARAAKALRAEHPGVCCHISSGDASDVLEQLDKGLIDFGVLFEPSDTSEFNCLKLPQGDIGGVLMRRDSPLAEKTVIMPEDLWDKPLIVSRQHKSGGMMAAWLQKDFADLDIAATYSLVYNASLMVAEGVGYALCRGGSFNFTCESDLAFRPFEPPMQVGMSVLWKKHKIMSKPAERFLCHLRAML